MSAGGIAGLILVTSIFISGVILAQPSFYEETISSTDEARSDDASKDPTATKVDVVPRNNPLEPISENFSHCGLVRRTCVVDGDTFWLRGQKIRIADIDTPEVSRPSCPAEKVLGDRATARLISLLNEGPFEVSPIGNRDEDQYERKLRVVLRDGRSIGDQLVAEGLAHTWTGRREPWC